MRSNGKKLWRRGSAPASSREAPSIELDVAALLLRSALGVTFVAHGLKHARTLDGTAAWFESVGFRRPGLQARASAVAELGAGAALLAGAATPLSCAAVVGTMGVAYRTVHRPNGYYLTAEGWEYVGFISATAVALSALGPGHLSIDRALGVDRVGLSSVRAAATATIGVVAAIAQTRLFWERPTS